MSKKSRDTKSVDVKDTKSVNDKIEDVINFINNIKLDNGFKSHFKQGRKYEKSRKYIQITINNEKYYIRKKRKTVK